MMLVPGTLLTAASGVLFGVAFGTAVSVVSATTAATICFLIGRRLGREQVEQIAGERVEQLDDWIARNGFVAVLYVRLIPLVPFNALNYVAGVSAVDLRSYVAATAVGIIPGTFAYTALGGSFDEPTSPEFIAAVALIVVLAAAAPFVQRVGRRRGLVPDTAEESADRQDEGPLNAGRSSRGPDRQQLLQAEVLDRVEDGVLRARGNERPGVGVRHRVRAGLQALLRRADPRVAGRLAALQQLPRGFDVVRVHEGVHDVRDRLRPVAADRAHPAESAQQAQRPRRAAAQDAGVAGDRARSACGDEAALRVVEVHPAERGEEIGQRACVARVVLVEQRRVAVRGDQAVRGPVAAHVTDLLGVEVQPRAGARFDPPPHLVGRERAEVILPAALVADVRGGLEREHPKAHVARRAQHVGDLVDVARSDRHVVGEVARDAVRLVEAREHVAEVLAVGVQVGLAARPAQPTAAEHERVEVPGEREVGEARPASLRVEREPLEVRVVEVAVRHRHR
ncbi:MAG: TVP38/TMEM64 family protein, partial [Actinobacteria bacterium]|nr:TVP38/TMEM64 family protein [Actinomycetota bacterium]